MLVANTHNGILHVKRPVLFFSDGSLNELQFSLSAAFDVPAQDNHQSVIDLKLTFKYVISVNLCYANLQAC